MVSSLSLVSPGSFVTVSSCCLGCTSPPLVPGRTSSSGSVFTLDNMVDAVAARIQERMTRVSNSSCLYRLFPGYTGHQLSIGQFLGQPIINKVLVSICSGNIFGLPKKSGSILGQIMWENLGFSSFGGKSFLFLVKLWREAFAPQYLGWWTLCTQFYVNFTEIILVFYIS